MLEWISYRKCWGAAFRLWLRLHWYRKRPVMRL